MSARRTILDLDDYSLRHVFSFFPDLRDKVSVGYTCLRFRSIIGPLIGKQQVVHDWYHWESGDPKQFYANYGIYIKQIHIEIGNLANEFFSLIPKYCHNIEDVRVHLSRDVHYEFVKNMLASNKSIKHLELYTYSLYASMGHIVCEHISRLQGLETLILRFNHFSGEHFYRLTNLKQLNFEECEELNPNHFIGICQVNKLLKLNIVGCRYLNTKAFQTLVETQTELEEIYVDSWYPCGEVSRVALIENLRRIHINYLYYPGLKQKSNQLLKELSEYSASSLKYLKINCECVGPPFNDLKRIQKLENFEELVLLGTTNLNDSLLTHISKACKRLQRVNVRRCHQITNEGILQLIRNLKLLIELSLENINLTDELYQDMCETKRSSNQNMKLKVHLHRDANFLNNVTDEQLRTNQNLVQLFFCWRPFSVPK